MLADLECGLGNLGRCFELQERARGHAQRFGHSTHIQWFRAERVAECYWTGLWDEALLTADEIAGEGEGGSRHFMDGYCRVMRGRIRLARSDVEGALADAAEALSQARESSELQMLYPALAFCARALAAAGDQREAGRLADELLGEWQSKLTLFPASSWVVDLAGALELLGREIELAEAVAGLDNRSAWLDAAVAYTGREYDLAAELFREIGSRPDEALARLRAAQMFAENGSETEALAQLEQALGFFRDVDGAAYLSSVEALLADRQTRL